MVQSAWRPTILCTKIGDQLAAIRRVHHFRVEHGRVIALRLVDADREGGVFGHADDFEAYRRLRDAVAMAHPDRIFAADFPEAVEERGVLEDFHIRTAEIGGMTTFNDTAQLLHAMVCWP